MRTRLLAAAFCAVFAMMPTGCLDPEPESESYLHFQNLGVTDSLDSLRVMGVNAQKGDTLPILGWVKGQGFPAEVPYPPELEAAFTLLVRGYRGDALVYESHTPIADGQAQPRILDMRMAAPVLPDLVVSLTARLGDSIELRPVWETRPGIYRRADSGEAETFTPEAVYFWYREGNPFGRDSGLALKGLGWADSGAYLFSAVNAAGRDSLEFRLHIKHKLPVIANIKAQAAVAGKPLKVIPAITRSDTLRYRWMRKGATVSTDTALAFAALAAADTGVYQLRVVNASDTADEAVSNLFSVGLAPDPNDVWQAEVAIPVGAQAVENRGSALDLDLGRAMFHDEASAKENTIDLLYLYSGAALRLMSPVAAKAADDLTYADAFSDTQIKDIKYVKVTGKPATPSAGRALFDKGPQVNSLGVTGGQSFLVKTTGGKLVWLKVVSYAGSGSSATAEMTMALGPY
jgi:hypothetical protein